MKPKSKKVLCVLALALCCGILFTACRPSTALTRLMNVANALNPSTEEALSDEESEEDVPDDEDPVEEQSDDGQIEELENTIGQMMEDLLENETTAEQALQAVYSALAEDDEWGEQEVNTEDVEITTEETKITVTLPGGSESSEGQGSASGVTTSNGQESESAIIQPEEEKDEDEEEQENEKQEDEPETSENTSGGENGGEEENKDLVNNDNPESDYEELETAEGQVAATGQLAILVSMLGGGDRLCATSADYNENELAQKAFSDGDYEVLWDGDGSSPMSDEKFETLLAMKPGLCVEISGYNTFSDAQIQQLKAAGITYAAVDGFTSAEKIESTVNELATLLGDTSADGGTNAPEIAANYLDWCADIEKDLANIETSSEIVFIEDWDEDVEVVCAIYDNEGTSTYTYTGRSYAFDTGMAIIRPGTLFRPLSDYLSYANVTDYSSQPNFQAIYGDNDTTVTWTEYTSYPDSWKKYENYTNYALSGDLAYISPLLSYAWAYVSSLGKSYYSNCQMELVNANTGIKTSLHRLNSSVYSASYMFNAVPGFGSDSGYSTVIVKSGDVKMALENSKSWSTNSTTGNWGTSWNNIGRSTKWELDFTDSLVSDVYTWSWIGGEYAIYVNPTGLGDWVDGSPESILESVWVACQVQGYYTESKMKTIIRDFYSTFYGYSLSDSEMTAILAGP